MCTQTHNHYLCGCKQKGEFEQCDRLYDLGMNLQCAVTTSNPKVMRSYCATHLLKEGKATVVYPIKKRPHEGVQGQAGVVPDEGASKEGTEA